MGSQESNLANCMLESTGMPSQVASPSGATCVFKQEHLISAHMAHAVVMTVLWKSYFK